ncbi:hydrogenase maturation protease [Planctomycetota bacterium]
MKKDIVVLGLGNPLMTDEGVGSCLIEDFQNDPEQFGDIEFIDAGTGGMSLLYLIADRKKIVIIDCAYMQTSPGTIRRFTPDDVKSVKKLAHHSLHEVDILKVLELAKELGQCPEEIVIFGIEPESVEVDQKLSETVSARIPDYIKAISSELVS